MKILVTGVCGFIGFNLAKKFLNNNLNLVIYGIDNFDDYYSVDLKKKRLSILKKFKNFKFKKVDIFKKEQIKKYFKNKKFDYVIHLAAQAGVRYSLLNPKKFINVNLIGYINLLEEIKRIKPKKTFYASSSSVYGDKKKFPLKENIDISPKNIYSATKKINEDIASDMSKISNMKMIGLRFFTVYGEYGRPDMAIFKFTKNIIKEKKISVFNYGKHFRDFTHVNDVAETIYKITKKKQGNKKIYQIFNVGSGKPIKLMKIIKYLEQYIGKKAKIKFLKKQPGDMKGTFAKNENLKKIIGFKQKVNIKEGLKNFVDWYKKNY